MPKPKSSGCARRRVQDTVRHCMRQSTCASTRCSSNTGITPQPDLLTPTAQPYPLGGQSLSDLLSLIREQAQAEVQAQQASTGQNGRRPLAASTTERMPETNEQRTATMIQPTTGTFLCD